MTEVLLAAAKSDGHPFLVFLLFVGIAALIGAICEKMQKPKSVQIEHESETRVTRS